MRRALLIALAVSVVALGGVALSAYREVRAAEQYAGSAIEEGRLVARRLARGDAEQAANALDGAILSLRAAELNLDSTSVRLLGVVPFVGSELRAARAGVVSARESVLAAESVVGFLASERPPLLERDRVDPEGLLQLVGHLREGLGHAEEARRLIEEAPHARTAVVAERLAQADEASALVAQALRGGLSLAERLHQSASGGDAYRMLVLIENGAELRATGGLMGFVALLELEDGRLQLERVDGIRRLTRGQSGDRRVVAAPRDYLERYGKYEANTTLWLNINLSPHFPSVAEVARNLYWEVRDVEVDTVARVDLVAVGYLIDALGGVSVEGERIRGSDLATDFLIDSYLRFPDVVEQNEYLTRVAEVAFRQILSGERREGTQVLNALRRTLEERRASVVTWQSELDELLSSFGGSGALLSGDPGDLEVVVQNFASNKIDLFTEQAITVSAIPVGCSVFGQVELIVENAAPQWAIDLPHGELGIRGQWWVNVYLPRQAQLRALLVDGDPAEGSLEEEQGRPVAATLIAAAPGEEVTVTVRWEESISDSLYQLRLQPQPLVSPATLDLGIEDPLRFTTTQERSVSTACREAGS